MFFKRKKKRIAYLKENFAQVKKTHFDFELIGLYHENKETTESFQVISDQIWNDLDMDLFYAHIDYTTSTIGQQYLYNQLRTNNCSKKLQNEQEEIIENLQKKSDIIAEIQFHLEPLSNKKSYYLPRLFQGKHIKLPKWFFIVPLLSITVVLSILLSFFSAKYLLITLALFPINAAIHYYNKMNVNIYIDSIPMLLSLSAAAKKIITFKEFTPLFKNREKSIEVINQVKRRIAVFKLEQKIESETEVIYWFILELIKITFILEPLLLFSVIGKLKANRTEIEDVFTFVGQVDTLLSIIAMRKESEQFCIPSISDQQNSMLAKNMIHPLVPNCVPNSFETSSKSFLITGSNMSGKTTFIRAIGINIISGSTLNTCFATSFKFPVTKIQTAIRISDDIASASSYFFSEVSTIKEILNASETGMRNIILLDELFKGTNTIERIASAKAILSYLEEQNCLIFVSTHDLELTTMLKEEYHLFHFEESINEEKISFDFKLKKGIPTKGNAIEILRLNQFPKSIIAEASAIASKMRSNNSRQTFN
jgi:hypothetical protein